MTRARRLLPATLLLTIVGAGSAQAKVYCVDSSDASCTDHSLTPAAVLTSSQAG